jgi:CRP/FNR family cyclic AMP-dependent transcriptional regulator
MTTTEILQALRALRFSGDLSEEDLNKLAGISEFIDFPAGATIFSEGDKSQYIFLLRNGRVELRMCAPAKGCLTLLTLEGGDLLGWSPAILEGEMTATAVTVKETQAIRIASEKLQSLCDADHDIGYEMMRRVAIALSRRLVATRLQVLDVHDHTPPSLSRSSTEGRS